MGDASKANTNVVPETRPFKIAQANLFRYYSHFLKNSVIKDIFVHEDPNTGIITYNVIYSTRSTDFLAIISYDEKNNKPEIKSLVVADDRDFEPSPAHCLIVTDEKCEECEEDFNLDSNGYCYKKLENCELSSGNICYLCEAPYELVNGSCEISCGLLCERRIFDKIQKFKKA